MTYAKIILLLLFVICPDGVYATQAHGDPEGIFSHQFSHVFFMASMLILIYWLRQKNLTQVSGWRFIQFAAVFFIVWNINVIWVHYLDEQAMLVSVENPGFWQIKIHSSIGSWAAISYYLGKMDHLFCVPAMICLFIGLKKLAVDAKENSGGHVT